MKLVMKYTMRFSAMTLFAFSLTAVTAPLQAADSPFAAVPPIPVFDNGAKLYAGAALSRNGHSDICNDAFFAGTCHDSDNSWKVYGGARLNPMMGFEAAYARYGEAGKAGITAGGGSVALSNELTSLNAAGVGYMPVAPQMELLGKAGLAFWKRDSSKTIGTTTEHSKDNGASPLIGLGAQYQIQDNLHLRGEWEHIFNAGDDAEFETDVNSLSIGLMFQTL